MRFFNLSANAFICLTVLSAIPSSAVNPDYLGMSAQGQCILGGKGRMSGAKFTSPWRLALTECTTVALHVLADFLLDIQLNKSLKKTSKVSYGTVVQINKLNEWEDKQIVDLAFAAHTKVHKQFDADSDVDRPGGRLVNPKRDRPTVTTTLVVDDTAYIATSLKGHGKSYIYEVPKTKGQPDMTDAKMNPFPEGSVLCNNFVIDGLRLCQETAVETKRAHKNNANCGEYMATLAYCLDTQRTDISGARIVSVKTDTDGSNVIIPPCDDNNMSRSPENQVLEEWGCMSFFMALGLGPNVDLQVIPFGINPEAKEVSADDIVKGTRSDQISYP